MKDEILPFSRDVEIGATSVLSTNQQCTSANEGKIIKDSMQCVFNIYYNNGQKLNNSPIELDCSIDERKDYELFKDFRYGSDPQFVNNPIGTYYINLQDTQYRDIFANNLGEYKITLDEVRYEYCGAGGKVMRGNPYARVCEINVAVSDHYLLQK